MKFGFDRLEQGSVEPWFECIKLSLFPGNLLSDRGSLRHTKSVKNMSNLTSSSVTSQLQLMLHFALNQLKNYRSLAKPLAKRR